LIPTLSEPKPKRANLSKPTYQNTALEDFIAGKKGETELKLSWKNLTDKDLEIVAYYALQENKVSGVIFYVII
jgi:hypothetical protein